MNIMAISRPSLLRMKSRCVARSHYHHHHVETFIHSAQLTSQMFAAAVFVYTGLNYAMYRRVRRDIEQKKKDVKDAKENAKEKL